MPLSKHFIEQGIKLMQINEYLRSELVRAGFAGVDLQKTPLGVRITLKTSRPGLVIGKGGKRIQEITDVLEQRFGLEVVDKNGRSLGTINYVIRDTWSGDIKKYIIYKQPPDKDISFSPDDISEATESTIKLNSVIE